MTLSRKNLRRLAMLLALPAIAALAVSFFFFSRVQAESGAEVTYTTRSDVRLSQSYLDRYAVPADDSRQYYIAEYSVNGGNYGSNVPANAFDGNFDTFWETNTVNSDTFTNHISVRFNEAVTIDRVLFATRRDGQWQKGFPLKATFLSSEDGEEYRAFAAADAELKNNVVVYTFESPVTAQYLRFEYTQIYAGMTQHASASELIFLRPEEEIVNTARHLFADYMQTQLLPQFNDRDTLLRLREQLIDHPLYEGELSGYIQRALSVLDGTLMPDLVNRQFTTDPNARGKFIQQRGDIFAYGQELRFMFGLSNYLPTGIYGNSGEQITVYVEADEGQPLPKLVFTQFLTTYQYWQGGQVQLQRGVNVLTVPNFTHTASFTNAGGPLYIVNPYTSKQQNESIKLYIEGGHTFPVFYEGGSEEKFLHDLADHVEYCQENGDTAFNIAEVMSDHILVTAQATRALEIYAQNGVSVEKACADWDAYMQALLEFNGVTFDPSDSRYDERVQGLYLNVRVMQPFSSAADAYATGQHIGIRINTGWEATALRGSGFGWGTSHEIGHVIEIGEYRVLEYTNNMVSNFNETVLDGLASRGDHKKITDLLAPDGTAGIASGGSYDNTYVVWWNIESVFPGYWGRYNNLFRYGVPQGYPSAERMSAVEKQVYYSSIATGIDTGYYFDRYGYRFNGSEFSVQTASAAYTDAVNALKGQGKLSEKQLKFWYAGADTATLNYEYGDKLSVYGEDTCIQPLYIGAEGGGYRIQLPDRSSVQAHLGYEICENGKVIGFTTSATYFDDTAYAAGYVPRYQIRAYDQKLNATAPSEVWQFTKVTPVAQIGSVQFTSLAQALSAAEEGDEIVLLSDIAEEGLTVAKSVTVTNGGKKIGIFKIGGQNIFNIQSGVTLTLQGSAEAPIYVDGSGVARQGRVFSSAGSLALKYVDFQNLNGTDADGTAVNLWGEGNTLSLAGCSFTNVSGSGRGGAVYVVANDSISVTIEDCVFTGNSTSGANGGALFLGAPSRVTDCVFTGNRSSNSGGALYIGGKGSLIQGCKFSGNYADAQDYKGGGALFLNAACTVEDCNFAENSAFTGWNGGSGGAVYAASGDTKFVSCSFGQNKAFVAGGCYIGSGLVQFEGCTFEGNGATSTGGAVYVNWSTGKVGASFESCTLTQNTSGQAGILYINYYFYPNYSGPGLGQTQLDFTNSRFEDNASGGAALFTNYTWLVLNAEGSTVTASVNKKVELKSGYEQLTLTLLQDTGTDGEIVRRSDTPLGEDVYEHFLLGDALALKYRLELGQTGNSLWLRQLQFGMTTDDNGQLSTGDALYVYGDLFTMPSAPTPPYGHTFEGWRYGDSVYQAGEEVTLINGDKITAVYKQYLFHLNLVYADGRGTTAQAYEKGDVIDLSDLTAPDQNFAGWLYKGAVYYPGDKIVFDGKNDTFVALYTTDAPDLPDDGEEGGGNEGEGEGEDTLPETPTQPPQENDFLYVVVVGVVVLLIAAGVVLFALMKGRKKKQ